MFGCPVYMKVGGYPYGWAYSGPMGQVLNPLLVGLDKTQDLYHACTLCNNCKTICPGGIDHPSMFLSYRAQEVDGTHEGKPRPQSEKWFMKAFTWATKRAWHWNFGIKSVRPFINRYASEGVIAKLTDSFEGWFKSRNLPALAKKTFHERMKEKDNRTE